MLDPTSLFPDASQEHHLVSSRLKAGAHCHPVHLVCPRAPLLGLPAACQNLGNTPFDTQSLVHDLILSRSVNLASVSIASVRSDILNWYKALECQPLTRLANESSGHPILFADRVPRQPRARDCAKGHTLRTPVRVPSCTT